jgi:hypothetical protein
VSDWFASTAANPSGIDATLAVAAGWLVVAPFLTLAVPSVRSLTADGHEPVEPRVADEVQPVAVGDDR